MTTMYRVNDAHGSIDVPARNARTAAEIFARSYDADESTFWVRCRVRRLSRRGNPVGEPEEYRIAVDPDAPDCEGDHEHDWRSPYSVVGGIEENPGVWGSGGGVKIKQACSHCGTYRWSNSWAHDPETGEQGLDSVRYEAPDSTSIEWVQGLREGT